MESHVEVHTVFVTRTANQNCELARQAERLGFPGITFVSHDTYFLSGCTEEQARAITSALVDEPFVRDGLAALPQLHRGFRVHVTRRPGVTDRVAHQLGASASAMGIDVAAATGSCFDITPTGTMTEPDLSRLVEALLCNLIIETWTTGAPAPGFVCDGADPGAGVARVALCGLADDGLASLSKCRGLALDLAEMRAVQEWFRCEGREPNDAELETIAQTWSEHCSHKTFKAAIVTPDGPVEPLMQQLRRATVEIDAPFVVSAFDGNAGIIRFGSMPPLAVKVETHNHPSAVEPFGGANTGVGGVVRDVLAAPARPVALTDILCFGRTDTAPADIPEGVLHPALIEDGVVAGVADYGNKLGVPTVAGAVLYDNGYLQNPLVFCGCVGEVMEGFPAVGLPRTGDRIVVIGGGTGRDGIKGATFSSMTMDATTGQVAGASVQIGDPIVERLVGEVLTGLLDRPDPLCSALTDCGAGGLSSAVGELADGIGASVQLENVPLKYAGLQPWEVWLSEAQERMVLAVAPVDLAAVLAVCARHGVEAADIGEFTGGGRLVVCHGPNVVVDLPTDFLHGGRPPRSMTARPRRLSGSEEFARIVPDHRTAVLGLLAHPTIASKESVVRRYDHHVLGSTVVGPMAGQFQLGPSDGSVIAHPESGEGFAIGVGVNPQYGIFDPEAMAWSAVDEALRNVVVAGADPAAVALLDNFSWGDPTHESTLGDLVHAVKGCCDAARAFAAPFVSGKDSLNNEYEDARLGRHSIPPTLVITALAHVPDADRVPGSALQSPGNVVVLVGRTHAELRGSHLDLLLGADHGGEVPAADRSAPRAYRAVHEVIRRGLVLSAHDVSEGGLAVALSEMSLTTPGVSLDVDLRQVHADDTVALYSESNGRMLLEVAPGCLGEVLAALGDRAVPVGRTIDGDSMVIVLNESNVTIANDELLAAWGGRR